MNSGVYTIENLIDNKLYVGYAVNFNERWNDHIKKLRIGKHKNRHLRGAWKIYGENAFRFEILEECPEEYLCCQEHYWALMLNVHDENYGYNIRPTHPHGHPRHSAETRKLIGERGKGRPVSEELKAAARLRRHSPEVRAKISEAGKKRVYSEESKERMRAAQKKAAMRRGLLGHEERERRRIKRSKEYDEKKRSGWERSYKLFVYNENMSLYKRYMTKADAMEEFGMKRTSTTKLLQVIDKNILYLDKYWKTCV